MFQEKLIILYMREKQMFIYSVVSIQWWKQYYRKKIILWCTSLEGREGEEREGEGRELPQIYQPNGSLDVYYHKPNESITF